MNSAGDMTMNSKTLRTGTKITCEGSHARVHQTFPSRGEVVVRWLETGTFSTLKDDVLAECQAGWR